MDHSDELQDERKSKLTNTNDLEQRIVKEKTKNVPGRNFISPYEINPGSAVKRSTFSSIVRSSQLLCRLIQRDIRQRLNLVIVGPSQWMNSSLQSSDRLLDSTARRNNNKQRQTKQMQVIHLNVVETRWVWRSFRKGWQSLLRSSP